MTPPRPARGRPPLGPPVPPAGSGLLVLGPAERRGYWRCRCECCRECEVRRDRIVSGESQSCGCRRLPAQVAGGIAGAKIRWGKRRAKS